MQERGQALAAVHGLDEKGQEEYSKIYAEESGNQAKINNQKAYDF